MSEKEENFQFECALKAGETYSWKELCEKTNSYGGVFHKKKLYTENVQTRIFFFIVVADGHEKYYEKCIIVIE